MSTTAELVIERLQSYELRKEAGEWRCNSPFRPGANSHSFTLKIEDGEHGAWFDHMSEEKGSLYDLAEKLGIETPKREAVVDSKRKYAGLEDYATAHGVPAKAFIDAQWKEVQYQGRPALQFPTATGKRWRFLDGDGPSFKSDRGYRRCWFGLARAAELANEVGFPLIIVNGEPSVIVCHHFGLPACGVTSGEKKDIPAALLDELKEKYSGEIVVALDCDSKGRSAARGMVEQLTGAGFTARAIDLMLGDKGDAADFCRLHTTGALKKLYTMPELAPVERVATPVKEPTVETLNGIRAELAAARTASDSERYGKLIDTLAAQLDDIVKSRTSAPQITLDIVRSVRGDVATARAGGRMKRGLLCGIKELDELLGGFRPGVYSIIADTGMGKSWCATSIAKGFMWRAAGAVIPTESMPEVFVRRMAGLISGVNEREFEHCTETEYKQVDMALDWLCDEEHTLDFCDEHNPNPRSLIKWVETQLAAGRGYKWIVLDSLSNVGSTFSESIFERTSAAADAAQIIARMGLVVVCTAQVGRKMEGRSDLVPSLHDAKGSGRIEENSDVVLALYNHARLYKLGGVDELASEHHKDGHLMLRCLKHRTNDQAEGKDIFVRYLPGQGIMSCLPETVQKAVA